MNEQPTDVATYDADRGRLAFYFDSYWGGDRYRCPSSPRANTLTVGADGSTFGSDDTAPTGATGYSINSRLVGNDWQEDHPPQFHGGIPQPLSLGALDFPAVTILLTESSTNCSDGCTSSDENEWGWEGRHVDKLYGDGWDYGSAANSAYIGTGRPPLGRHTGGGNYALADGHSKFYNAGGMGQLRLPATGAQAETAAAVVADITGSRPTYCPNTNCQYNVPITNK